MRSNESDSDFCESVSKMPTMKICVLGFCGVFILFAIIEAILAIVGFGLMV